MTTTITPVTRELPDLQEAREIAVEAYVYLYPLVNMDVARLQLTNIEPGKRPGFGPMNTVNHMRAFPPGNLKLVARPNFDTLYSSMWFDLTDGPVVVSVPDTGGRLYLLPLLDMWTDSFASIGKRTTGTRPGHFAVVPPGWQGELPAGVRRIDAPTPYVWSFGRTQTNGPADYEAVHQVQDGYLLTPLSQWGQPPSRVTPPAIDPDVDMTTPTLEQVNAMSAAQYFAYAAELMKLHPPHSTDWSILTRMERIGFGAGESFDLDSLDPALREAIEQAPAAGQQAMREKLPSVGPVVNGWQMVTETVGVYGNAYLKRALLAILGMGANPPEDSIYPLALTEADGTPLTGEHDYLLHFDQSELPPVGAFWSVTLYDTEGFQVPNPLDRFAIGDRDPLTYNSDGSLDVYISTRTPAPNERPTGCPPHPDRSA
jgi:hypothetical protein